MLASTKVPCHSVRCCRILKVHSSTGLGRCQALLAGIWHCGETVIKEEGVRALWKGLTPFAVHLTLKYALRMGTNAMYQSLLRDEVCH